MQDARYAPNPAKLRVMAWVRKLSTLILLTGTAQCGSTSDAPPGQVLLFIATDAPSASRATGVQGFLADASVDTLRIDILAPDNTVVRSVDVAAPDEANWPVSFGIQGVDGAAVTRLRLRAFRAQRSSVVTDEETGAKVFEPIAGYTIDRVVELPVPNEKGVFGFRVVLRSRCRGHRPDFTQRTTCVSGERTAAGFREAIEAVDLDAVPPREPMWWPSEVRRTPTAAHEQPADCVGVTCPQDSVCIPGGFFMLGNLRVVGFGAQKDAVPAHPVAMRPFCIDRTELTLGRYASKLAWPSPVPKGVTDPFGTELCTWLDRAAGTSVPTYPDNAPVNCIDHDQAAQACAAFGGRLPTEAEWEYVATGLGRGTLFPWSDEPPDCETGVFAQQATEFIYVPECPQEGIVPVDEVDKVKKDRVAVWHRNEEEPGAEVWHMGGSLSEWTLDSFVRYGETEQSRNCWQREGVFDHPSCASVSTTFSVRGGNFVDSFEAAYSALRRSETNTAVSELIGFRCVYPAGDTDPAVLIGPSGQEDTDTRPPEPGANP